MKTVSYRVYCKIRRALSVRRECPARRFTMSLLQRRFLLFSSFKLSAIGCMDYNSIIEEIFPEKADEIAEIYVYNKATVRRKEKTK